MNDYMPAPPAFVGRTRFSVFTPGSNAWHATRGGYYKSEEEYLTYLYSDERLSMRLGIFSELSLPHLHQMSLDYELIHLIEYSSQLPVAYQEKLVELEAKYPFIVLDQVDSESRPQWQRLLLELVKNRQSDATSSKFGFYRLDDDDVLPVSFFKRAAEHIENVPWGYAISFGTGLSIFRVGDQMINPRVAYSPLNAQGQMYVGQIDHASGDIQLGRFGRDRDIDKLQPTILDSRDIGFLQFRSANQDTLLHFSGLDVYRRAMSYMDQHPIAENETLPGDDFPALAKEFKRMTGPALEAQEGPSTFIVTDEPTKYLTEPMQGMLEFNFSIQGPSDAGANDILVSLDLSSEIEGDVLVHTGLKLSKMPGIGYYFHLKTQAGPSRTRSIIILPSGIACTGFSVRRFQSAAGDYRLDEVKQRSIPLP